MGSLQGLYLLHNQQRQGITKAPTYSHTKDKKPKEHIDCQAGLLSHSRVFFIIGCLFLFHSCYAFVRSAFFETTIGHLCQH